VRLARTGDLVVPDLQMGTSGISEWWGSKTLGLPPIFGYFDSGSALVLEDLHHQGGNGCRILTSDGRVGWVNVVYLRVVE
jgi:hypothetical protein